MRADARAANAMKPVRTLWLLGVTSYSASAAVTGTAANVIFGELGVAAEMRFVPGIGISAEIAPQYALSGGDQLSSPLSIVAEVSVVFWTDLW